MNVCVCVCVCLYTLTIKASSVCNDVWGILEGTDRQSFFCEYYSRGFCQVASSPFPKMSYFTPKEETPASRQTEEKKIRFIAPQKDDIY